MPFGAVSHDLNRAIITLKRLLEEPQSRRFVRFLREIAHQDFTFVIDGALQVMCLAVDFHKHLINVPPPPGVSYSSADPLPLDISCEHGSELVPSDPHGFMADVYSALERQIFDISK